MENERIDSESWIKEYVSKTIFDSLSIGFNSVVVLFFSLSFLSHSAFVQNSFEFLVICFTIWFGLVCLSNILFQAYNFVASIQRLFFVGMYFSSICEQFRQQILVSLFYFPGSFYFLGCSLVCFLFGSRFVVLIFFFYCFLLMVFFLSNGLLFVRVCYRVSITWRWRWPIGQIFTWITLEQKAHMRKTIVGLHKKACRIGLSQHIRPLHVCCMCVKYKLANERLRVVKDRAHKMGGVNLWKQAESGDRYILYWKVSTKLFTLNRFLALLHSIRNCVHCCIDVLCCLLFQFFFSFRFWYKILFRIYWRLYIQCTLLGAFNTQVLSNFITTFAFFFCQLTCILHKKFCGNCCLFNIHPLRTHRKRILSIIQWTYLKTLR